MTQPFDVFMSHSSVDKPWVRKLVADLVTHYGVSVWLDENEIRPGDLFANALERGIDESRCMALVISPESMASGWVQEERNGAVALSTAKDRQLRLIPVLLRTAKLPLFLTSRDPADFREPSQYASALWKLAWGITGKKPAHVIDLPYPSVTGAGMAAAPAPVVAPAHPAPARPPAPARSAPNREAALIALLTEIFNVSELQQWIYLHLGQDVLNGLRLDSSLSQLAFDTMLAVQQRGLADRSMFESLLAKRPRHADQIRDVARLYGVTLAP